MTEVIRRESLAARVDAMERALIDLTDMMYLVFENDWDHTRFMLGIARDSGSGIVSGRTFLNPGVPDESNDWANRGGLLDAYRAAVRVLREYGIDPEKPGPR